MTINVNEGDCGRLSVFPSTYCLLSSTMLSTIMSHPVAVCNCFEFLCHRRDIVQLCYFANIPNGLFIESSVFLIFYGTCYEEEKCKTKQG